MTQYEFTAVTAVNHVTLVAECNALGADGWQMVTIDRPHEFWTAFLQRERIEGVDPVPAEHDRTGVGVFGVMGGDANGTL